MKKVVKVEVVKMEEKSDNLGDIRQQFGGVGTKAEPMIVCDVDSHHEENESAPPLTEQRPLLSHGE